MDRNAINASSIATKSEAIAGSDAYKLITPYTATQTLFARGLQINQMNMGVTIGATALTINGASGSALSSSNYATVMVPAKSAPGYVYAYRVTSNQSVASTNMSGNLFGTTASTAWASVMPIYIYAVSNDAEDDVTFFVSRVPHRTTAPAAANIAVNSGNNADTQGSFFTARNITATDYEGNPCVCLGAVGATKDASDNWAFQTANIRNGINLYRANELFTFPTLQFGATIDHGLPNGGTPINFTTSLFQYQLLVDGTCYLYCQMNNVVAAGTGAVNMRQTIPFVADDDGLAMDPAQSVISAANTMVYPIVSTSNYMEYARCTTGAKLLNSDAVSNLTAMIRFRVSSS